MSNDYDCMNHSPFQMPKYVRSLEII